MVKHEFGAVFRFHELISDSKSTSMSLTHIMQFVPYDLIARHSYARTEILTKFKPEQFIFAVPIQSKLIPNRFTWYSLFFGAENKFSAILILKNKCSLKRYTKVYQRNVICQVNIGSFREFRVNVLTITFMWFIFLYLPLSPAHNTSICKIKPCTHQRIGHTLSFFSLMKKSHRTYCIVLKLQNDINKTLESKHVAHLLLFNDCISKVNWNWQWLHWIKLKPYIFKWFKEHQLPTKVLKWNQIACSQ